MLGFFKTYFLICETLYQLWCCLHEGPKLTWLNMINKQHVHTTHTAHSLTLRSPDWQKDWYLQDILIWTLFLPSTHLEESERSNNQLFCASSWCKHSGSSTQCAFHHHAPCMHKAHKRAPKKNAGREGWIKSDWLTEYLCQMGIKTTWTRTHPQKIWSRTFLKK